MVAHSFPTRRSTASIGLPNTLRRLKVPDISPRCMALTIKARTELNSLWLPNTLAVLRDVEGLSADEDQMPAPDINQLCPRQPHCAWPCGMWFTSVSVLRGGCPKPEDALPRGMAAGSPCLSSLRILAALSQA